MDNNLLSSNSSTTPKTKLQIISRIIVFTVFAIVFADFFYMNIMGINTGEHQKCVIYKSLPKWGFYLYENVFELLMMVIIGVFLGVLAEQYIHKVKRFFPKNQFLAFLYAAILPICSCGIIPLIDIMKKRTSLKVIITFICAAPLLNPYIIFLSYTVLGAKYALLRIVCSFLLSVMAGWIVAGIAVLFKINSWCEKSVCIKKCNPVLDKDPYVKTIKLIGKLLPYVIIAGILSFVFSVIDLKEILHGINLNREPFAAIVMTLIGIPIYMCHGADVIFLKPFLEYTDLSMGSAMAFSLSSSAICISSIIMLTKYLGKRITIILVGVIFVLIICLSALLNFIV